MSSNIGKLGVESIRIKGQEIQDLPLGLGNEAKAQLPMAIEEERLNKIREINKKYPTHRIDYLISRIKECYASIDGVRTLSGQQNEMISQYKGHISMCKHRDREIDKANNQNATGELDDLALRKKIKELKKQFPPYNVEAMEQQIKQCHEAIARCEDVIDQENESISEFRGVLALCRQRDTELARYNARAEGS